MRRGAPCISAARMTNDSAVQVGPRDERGAGERRDHDQRTSRRARMTRMVS